VFDIGKGNSTPITGLEFHRVPSSEKYFVLVTTPNRLYQFIGYVTNSDEKPLLQQIFNNYLTVPGNNVVVISMNSISGGTPVFDWRQTLMIVTILWHTVNEDFKKCAFQFGVCVHVSVYM
jgi:hypothetical protein